MKEQIEAVYASHMNMLKEKNKRYGNSALEPVGVFGKHVKAGEDATNSILIRLDDKLARVRNADELRKNDVSDIIGYLMLLSIGSGWDDFSDQVD